MTDTAELSIEEYRALLDEVFDEQVVGWTAEAEASERFPRKLIEHLGQSGVFAHKWGDRQHPDVAKLVALAVRSGPAAAPTKCSGNWWPRRRNPITTATPN